jgi:hypothetical protein
MAKFVLVALADQSDDDGTVRYKDTSADFFSKKCGIGVRTFWRQVGWLEDNGYLTRVTGGGRDHFTEFFLELTREVDDESSTAKQAQKNPCQIRQVPVPKNTSSTANDDIIHNTNQSTKESTSAREARSRGKARALARVAAVPALPNLYEWVIEETRWWLAIAEFFPERMRRVPRRYRYPGTNPEYFGTTGWYFLHTEVVKARQLAAAARGPPDDDSAIDAGSEPGNDDNARQSAASL